MQDEVTGMFVSGVDVLLGFQKAFVACFPFLDSFLKRTIFAILLLNKTRLEEMSKEVSTRVHNSSSLPRMHMFDDACDEILQYDLY